MINLKAKAMARPIAPPQWELNSSLSDLLNAKQLLEQENAALTNLLQNICNDYLDIDEATGKFTNSYYADTVNRLLGI